MRFYLCFLISLIIEATLIGQPKITGISPTKGGAGTIVVIKGTGFNTIPANNKVYFGNIKAEVVNSSSSSLTVKIPKYVGSIVPFSVLTNGKKAYSIDSSTPFFNSSIKETIPYFAANFTAIIDTFPSSIAVADFNNDGKPDLVTSNSSDITIFYGVGDGTFRNLRRIPLSLNPNSIAIDDFNGDGIHDIVTSNYNGTGSVILGVETEDFLEPISIYIGKQPSDVATADLNGDGFADIVSANWETSSVGVLLGNGDGTFKNVSNFETGNMPNAIALCDLNTDGNTDIAVTSGNYSIQSVLFGKGDGSFTNADTSITSNSYNSIAVADFNNDSKTDIVFANNNFVGDLRVKLGNGDGKFIKFNDYKTDAMSAISVGDFNGDGITDLAASNSNNPTVSIITGKGDGSFDYLYTTVIGANPNKIAIGDFNGDGKADFVTANNESNSITCFLNSVLATPSASIIEVNQTGFKAVWLSIKYAENYTIDLATDSSFLNKVQGFSDFNVGNTLFYAFTNLESGKKYYFRVRAHYYSETSEYSKTVSNQIPSFFISGFSPIIGKIGSLVTIYGNGFSANPNDNIVWIGNIKAKVETATLTSITCTVPEAAGSVVPISVVVNGKIASSITCKTPNFGVTNNFNTDFNFTSKSLSVGDGPFMPVISDFNSDGNADIVMANRNEGSSISLLLGNGNGTFVSKSVFSSEDSKLLAVGDFNCDGNQDIVVGNSYMAILTGNGDGTFKIKNTINVGNNPTSIVVTDFNNDGNADFATANYNEGSVNIMFGNGNGTFSSPFSMNIVNSYNFLKPALNCLTVADFNADNKIDIAVSYKDQSPSFISLLLGKGDGTFDIPFYLPSGETANDISTGDFNADGIPDIVTSNWSSNSVSVFIGKGNATFNNLVNYPISKGDETTWPQSAKIGDFNGDGIQDIVTPNLVNNSISVLIGKGDGTFVKADSFGIGNTGISLAIGDFNNDGKADIVSCDNIFSHNISIFLNTSKLSTSIYNNVSSQILTYPNPTLGILNINIPNDENTIISIYELTGKLIFTRTISTKKIVLDLSSLEKGLYLLSFNNKYIKRTQKLLIK